MKNKTFKNLIVLGILVILAATTNQVSAKDLGLYPYVPTYNSPIYYNNIYNDTSSYGYVPQTTTAPTTQFNYAQQQPYVYTQPQVQYIAQPAATQIQYVPQQQTVQYVQQQPAVKYVTTTNTQGASALNSVSTTTPTNKVVYGNTGYAGNTGNYIRYDGYNNGMGASAYGGTTQQVSSTPVVDSNGVTALSIKGSGSFMPSSVFQWIMLVLIILAIIVIARMIVRKSSNNDPHAVPTH